MAQREKRQMGRIWVFVCFGLVFGCGMIVGAGIINKISDPEIFARGQKITELENELQIKNLALYGIQKFDVLVKDTGTVSEGSSLSKAGVPVGSLVVFGEDGRIFAVYMYTPKDGDPFPTVDVYRWETDATPRQLLRKLPN